MASGQDISKLAKAEFISYDEDGKARLVGADIRSEQDEKDYTLVEMELTAEEFLEQVIAPRVQMAKEGHLDEPVWTDELAQWYVAIRNAPRMLRPAIMQRIRERRNYER